MQKLKRITQKIFAQNAPSEDITQFGTAQSSTNPVFTKDPSVIMSGEAYDTGYTAAVIDDYAPFLEDTNGLNYANTYQLAKLYQDGMPEYDEGTTYYTNSFCNYNGVFYKSIADNNQGNQPDISSDFWAEYVSKADTSELLTNKQITNCIISSTNPSITSTTYTNKAYVNKGCTVTSGIASGFSTSNYIMLNKTLTDSNVFTFEIPFTLNAITGVQPIVAINNFDNCIAIDNGKVVLRYDGNELDSSFIVSAGTEYYLKMERSASNYDVSIKTGSTSYQSIITLPSSVGYFAGKTIYLGRTANNYLIGSINLNNVSITADNASYWNINTLLNFQTVNVSGNFTVLMPDNRNVDNTLNNEKPTLTLDETLLYKNAGAAKTLLVKDTGELMIRDSYTESYSAQTETPIGGVWFDKTANQMKTQLATYPNLIINGATFNNGIASNFAQNKNIQLPSTYNLGTNWNFSLSVNIAKNTSSATNVIIGNVQANSSEAIPYLPSNLALIYDGNETVTAYLRRNNVFGVSKTETISTAYEAINISTEQIGYTSIEGNAGAFVSANTQIYSDSALQSPLETATANTWSYTGNSTQNTRDIQGFIRKAGTNLVASGVTVYEDQNLTTVQATATGTDYVYTNLTYSSIIGTINATVNEGETTLSMSYDGATYTLNSTTLTSSDSIINGFNVYLGSAPSLNNGYFNSTINIADSTFSFYTWNGVSSEASDFVPFVGAKIGTVSDNGTDITDLKLNLPVTLLKEGDISKTYGKAIGEIFPVTCTSSYVPSGALPCDGAEYSKTQFNDLWNKYLIGGLIKTCTYSEYSTMLANYGNCPMFAIDIENNKFKVPCIRNGTHIQQALSDSELGKAYNAGLPDLDAVISSSGEHTHTRGTMNITGQFGADDVLLRYYSGAFYNAGGSHNTGLSGSENSAAFGFDASRSWTGATSSNGSHTHTLSISNNSIYGNSDTVQTTAVALRYFIQVSTSEINESDMNWSAWASSLQGKLNADGTNLTALTGNTGVRAVTESYRNGANWYRIWSDGWVEQGGRTPAVLSLGYVLYINLLVPMNLDYTYQLIPTLGGNDNGFYVARGITAEYGRIPYFMYLNGALTLNNPIINWYACGYKL